MRYCASRFHTVRRPAREVMVGAVGVGGSHPLRVQSMTTTDTQDVAATVRQAIALAEVGCEIVRVTAPNVPAARCLREIRARFTAAGFGHVPLVADIHFMPAAAREAVEHVEKVRINPGNYADRKHFAVREYSDADYERELERLHAAFTPLVRRARELGRALRIGTNHGSLSDRIMNRYGDTPLGMVESALEFIRIAEAHDFHALILSMKASNPKVMIQAYRLLAARLDAEDRRYPLHLGVTEAGDGEDGRIKSAIGIGSLLLDGLGDTIRVSLTEDSVYEIPVARALADKAMALWDPAAGTATAAADSVDPFAFRRREIVTVALGRDAPLQVDQAPRVIVSAGDLPEDAPPLLARVRAAARRLGDTPIEGLLVRARTAADVSRAGELGRALAGDIACVLVELPPGGDVTALGGGANLAAVQTFGADDAEALTRFVGGARAAGILPVVALPDAAPDSLWRALAPLAGERLLVTLALHHWSAPRHAVGAWRRLVESLRRHEVRAPVWIRNTAATAIRAEPAFLSKVLEASVLTGALLADGIGDAVSIETETDLERATRLAYNVLQGAGARVSKTEYVACPSCGRTLFDLQATTQRIRAQTAHLKGVKLAIMGCIVNGPGEMADADFGYVGGAPGRINLYVGRQCVEYGIPAAEADARLIALIKAHGRWVEPPAPAAATAAARP